MGQMGSMGTFGQMGIAPVLRRALTYADFHPSRMLWLYAAGSTLWIAIGLWLGPHFDYTPYMEQWTRILAGLNPWTGDPTNAYGPGHVVLALLFYLHPLAPKLLFLLCWVGVFLIVFEAAGRDAAVGLLAYIGLFATPFFFILVCIYGVEDAFVTLLTLLAVDLRIRKAQCILPALLLSAAALTKLYPLALLPFLATDRGAINLRFVVVFALSCAAGVLITFALWGLSVLYIVEFAAGRGPKMLSIFLFLYRSGLSPLAGTSLAKAFIDWNAGIVAAALAVLYLVQLLARMPALTGTTIAMIGLLAFYKSGNPPYFVCSATLLIYFLATPETWKGRLDMGLLVAAAGYLLVLNLFQAWYIFFKDYPPVSAFVGLPCFAASVALLWRLVIHERVAGRVPIR